MEAYLVNQNESYGKSAYMLVYECKKKTPIRQIVSNDNEEEKIEYLDYRKIGKFIPDNIK